ncbi:MAG TPA: hypothetical protein VL728_19385 [Cyclobacteriaceae bacterium]|jgi:hypothetical protein|nr:hypothetical protein [Cyclobacteriaceae bacterium]
MDTLYNWLGFLVFYAVLAIVCMAATLGFLFFMFRKSSNKFNPHKVK